MGQNKAEIPVLQNMEGSGTILNDDLLALFSAGVSGKL